MNWKPFDSGVTIGTVGSENGTILCDEVFQDQARITLEEDSSIARFTITCGILGWMVHTRYFANRVQASREFERMKEELARMVMLLSESKDITLELEEFIRVFP